MINGRLRSTFLTPLTLLLSLAAWSVAAAGYPLTIEVIGSGEVSRNPSLDSYPEGAVVTVTALPAAGWYLGGWSGDAEGSAYQWWFAGAPITGATNATLILSSVQPNQHGAYHVVVSNQWGSATSSVANVTVLDECLAANGLSTCDETSLRLAVAAGGLVRICCNGTITLTETIEISRDVAIDARGRDVVISGNHAVRLFTVRAGVTFAVTNLTLTAGRHQGADGTNWTGIPGPGNPAPDPDPGKPGEGGAILNEGGHVLLVSSRLAGNHAVGGTGGISASALLGMGGEGRGGAVANHGGTVQLLAVTATSNVVTGGLGPAGFMTQGPGGPGLGAVIYSEGGAVEVDGSFLSNNWAVAKPGGSGSAAARGGAVYLHSGSATLRQSRLQFNQALGEASEVNGVSPGSGYGGAVAVREGTLTLEGCDLRSNQAVGGRGQRHSGTGEARGGAAFSLGTLRAVDSSFAENTAVVGGFANPNADALGGAIYSVGSLLLDRCAVVSNQARGGEGANIANGAFPAGHGLGGGLYVRGQAGLTNCTVALNTARGGDGAFPNGAPGHSVGGGVYHEAAGVSGVSLTVASNLVWVPRYWPSTPSPALVAGANVGTTNGTAALYNTVLAGGGAGSNVFGPVTDLGFNLSSDGSAAFSSGSSFNFTDARLGPLGNYGGSTPTLALRPSSPAIDFGASDVPLVDQRGLVRPFGAGVDIGAYEFHGNQTELPRLSIASDSGAVQLTFEAWAGSTYELQSRAEGPDWVGLETIGPFPEATVVQRVLPMPGPGYQFYRLELK